MFRTVTDERYIDGGRVCCPVRVRDVDVELCAGCRWATSVDLDGERPVVRCQPERPPVWLTRPWL